MDRWREWIRMSRGKEEEEEDEDGSNCGDVTEGKVFGFLLNLFSLLL